MSVVERVDMEPAYLLHGSAYRETSQIIELISQRHGRVSLVAKGARRPKSKWKSSLRPFQPLLVSWSGRGTLFTLRNAEPTALAIELTGAALMSAYYLNELLLTLTHRGDPHPALFAHYGSALAELVDDPELEVTLRRFELSLLSEVGYGLNMDHDVESDRPLEVDRRYCYIVDRGPVPAGDDPATDLVFTGAELHAIAAGELQSPELLKSAKRLLRAVLARRLGGRRLKSRDVFASLQRPGPAVG